MDLGEKSRALRGDGFQIATIKLPECPLCRRVRLVFIIEDDNAVPYCSVCRYTFTYVYRGEIARDDTTLFVKIYPNIPQSKLIAHLFDPKDIPTDSRQQNDSSASQHEVVTRPVNKIGSHPSLPRSERNKNQDVHQPPECPNAHKQVDKKILKYLREHDGTGTTKQMREVIGCSRQGFKDAVDKLIADGQIQRVKRGVYELINPS